jgi:hypothetical protein
MIIDEPVVLGRGFFRKSLKRAARITKRVSPIYVNRMQGGPTWNEVLMGNAEILGKAKKKGGFLNVIKSIGKFTRPITTAVAKTFLPASVVNAAAKLDPTAKKSGKVTPKAVQQAIAILEKNPLVTATPSDTAIKTGALLETLKNPAVLAIIGGGIVLLVLMRKK